MQNSRDVLRLIGSRERFLRVRPPETKTPDGVPVLDGEIVDEIPASLRPKCPRCKVVISHDAHGWLNNGYVNGKTDIVPCPECSPPVRERMAAKRRSQLTERLFGGVHIPQDALQWTFDTFPAHGDREALSLVRTFTNRNLLGDETAKRGLWLAGPTGRGKSSLAISALRTAVEHGRTGLFVLTADLFERIHASYRRDRRMDQVQSSRYSEPEYEESTDDILEAVSTVEWLVLDDLGVENSTDHAIRQFYLIIQRRKQAGLYTIFTSNLTPTKLEDRWRPANVAPGEFHAGQRVIERIREYCEGRLFKGDNLRK